VILKSWDLCHLKSNDLSFSQKFESLHLQAQIKFYGISKFTDQTKTAEHFLKKMRAGQICPERAETAPIRPRSTGEAREMLIQMAGRWGPAVSASGRPNRYAPFLAVRLSDDRRRSFVVSATEMRASARARVWSGAHRCSPGAARRRSGGGVWLRWVGEGRRGRWRGERQSARSWACSFTYRRSGEVGDGVGYHRFWPWKSIALASPEV
jgi:hypothetical protein